MHATPDLAEAARLMTVCNSCRYCEGLCAVFPAMEMRTEFLDADLNYLANLCHACGACYFDCQFSPPHEFNVNVPKTLAAVRAQSYGQYAWPRAFSPLFARNGVVMVAAVVLFVAGFVAGDGARLFDRQAGPGAFYDLMPHWAMTLVFGAALLSAVAAMGMGLRGFWRDTGEPALTLRDGRWLWQALKDSASLRYLDGGGAGCMNAGERPNDRRRMFHHLTAYGFALCFAATSIATLYHYAGWEAPYAWWDLPVLLGTAGGIGLVFGTAGLFEAKRRRDPAMRDEAHRGMEMTFLAMLFGAG